LTNSSSQKKKRSKNKKKRVDKVTWHWWLDFKDALVMFITWGEISCSRFTTWCHYALNLLEFWPIDLVGIRSI